MAFKNSLKIQMKKAFSSFAGRRLTSGPRPKPAQRSPPARLASPRLGPAQRAGSFSRAPRSSPRHAPDRVRACPPRGATRRRRPNTASTRRGSSGTAGHDLNPRAPTAFQRSSLLLSPRACHRHRAPRLAGARSPGHLSSPVTTPSRLQLHRHPAHPVLSLLCRGKHPVLGNCSPEHGRARW